MDKRDRNRKIVIALWLIVIWGHSLIPGPSSTTESSFWLNIISDVVQVVPPTPDALYILRKTAHFTEFLILGVLLVGDIWKKAMTKKKYFIIPPIATLVVACIDEFIQLFIPGRSGQLSDVRLDEIGALVGIALAMIISYNKRKDIKTEASHE